MTFKSDDFYIKKAISLANKAKDSGDFPFGSILVDDQGKIIMEDLNTEVIDNDISAHPELKIAKRAAAKWDKEFLAKCTMYNSAEPCTMCTGTIYRSGIKRIVFGISKKRLNEINKSGDGSIKYSIYELLSNSNKDFIVWDLEEEMKEEVEKPHL